MDFQSGIPGAKTKNPFESLRRSPCLAVAMVGDRICYDSAGDWLRLSGYMPKRAILAI